MLRSARVGLAVALGFGLAVCAAPVALGQAGGSLEGFFTGKQVVLKVDMPGTEKGVDLSYDKPAPMDWNQYTSRTKEFGVAIHKGEAARVTKLVVKSDLIEFHLDGGGFGTAHDDTSTTVIPAVTPKSQHEKDIEKEVSAATDPKVKRDLQNDLDRERQRREQMDAASRNQAAYASQVKTQQVSDRRLHGGSRFNLRWKGSIPADELNPDAVMKLLADYVDFSASALANAPPAGYAPAAPPLPPPMAQGAVGDAGANLLQLKRGLKMDEVTNLLGPGTVMSQSVSNDGLHSQVLEYRTADNNVDVTYVEGVVVRYSISSR